MSTPEPQSVNRRLLDDLITSMQWSPSKANAFKAAACMSDATQHANGFPVSIGAVEDHGSASVGTADYTVDNISESRFRELVAATIDQQVAPERRDSVKSAVLKYDASATADHGSGPEKDDEPVVIAEHSTVGTGSALPQSKTASKNIPKLLDRVSELVGLSDTTSNKAVICFWDASEYVNHCGCMPEMDKGCASIGLGKEWTIEEIPTDRFKHWMKKMLGESNKPNKAEALALINGSALPATPVDTTWKQNPPLLSMTHGQKVIELDIADQCAKLEGPPGKWTIENIPAARFRTLLYNSIQEGSDEQQFKAKEIVRRSATQDLTKAASAASTAHGAAKATSVWTDVASTPATGSAAGSKRSAAEALDLDDIDIPYGAPMDSCDTVRRKIRTFIESGAMKVGEFCDAIGVSNKSYNTFLNQSGPGKGSGTAAYEAAWEFFAKREAAGLKMPKKPKLVTEDGKQKDNVSPDIGDIHLPGEETDEVEVYDSCAEIRKKITAYLKRPGVTQAQFLRDLISQYHTDKAPARIQSSMLNKFRGHKGVDGGNTSSVFYASYCFFERLRIKEGKNKSKHRQEMGEAWGSQGGFDTKNAAGQKFYSVVEGTHISMDKLGKTHFH